MRRDCAFIFVLALSVCAGCSSSEQRGQCKKNADCPAGSVCIDNQCFQLCVDDASCLVGEQCLDGRCGPKPQCQTADDCSSSNNDCLGQPAECVDGACEYSILNGAVCDDANACTPSSACTSTGECVGVAIVCDSPSAPECVDGQVTALSVDGSCVPQDGSCVYDVEVSLVCVEDCAVCLADCCSLREDCAPSDDLNTPCIIESPCDLATCECGFNAAPVGTDCDDDDPCTAMSSCATCNASEPGCHQGMQCVGTPLADGSLCDGDGAPGVCVSGKCVSSLCLIAGVAYFSGTENPSNSCEVCDPELAVDTWSIRACVVGGGGECRERDGTCISAGGCSGAECCDYLPLWNGTGPAPGCGTSGLCDTGGQCVGCSQNADCDDTNPCTEDVCNTPGTCDYSDLNDVSCDSPAGASANDGVCAGSNCLLRNGEACSDSISCASGHCDGVCCAAGTCCDVIDEADCGSYTCDTSIFQCRTSCNNNDNGSCRGGSTCYDNGSTDTCTPDTLGSLCDQGSDCASGFCDGTNRCATGCVPGTSSYQDDGTFTVPANCTSIIVSAWGGGGGSGRNSNSADPGGSGGGGGYVSRMLTVSPGNTLNIVVGRGGKYGGCDPGWGLGGTGGYAGGDGGMQAVASNGSAGVGPNLGGSGGTGLSGRNGGPGGSGGGGGGRSGPARNGGGGGGATVLRDGITDLVVAGGGGGGGGVTIDDVAGDGGGGCSRDGGDSVTAAGGGGGGECVGATTVAGSTIVPGVDRGDATGRGGDGAAQACDAVGNGGDGLVVIEY